tara:strand:- start:151 stop:384 length:234 start_codon:yes stop_codon:yes gene_type:complete
LIIGRKGQGLLAPKKREKVMRFVILIAVVVIGLGIAGRGDMEDAIAEQAHYCDMVQLYKASNGENGWPNYKGVDCEG